MVEFTAIRSLSNTRRLLGRLEALGRDDFGGIQHWAMFDVLNASHVERAYPRLNTWREVRWELTNGGTVHTFNNDFTSRCGLEDPPARPTPTPTPNMAFLEPLLLSEAVAVPPWCWSHGRR